MATILIVIIRVIFGIALLILLTRLAGLRSFSKMSGFDFAITVAFGSVLAAIATTPDKSILPGTVALAALFAIQMGMAQIRARNQAFEDLIGNRPLLIMKDGEPLMENLNKAGMTHADLMGKLREANALDLSEVHAVVFEPTGDVSVLHGKKPDPRILEGVAGNY